MFCQFIQYLKVIIIFSIFRQKISPEESTISEVMAWYTSVNAAMLDILTNQIKETDNSGVWRLNIEIYFFFYSYLFICFND